MIRFGGDPFWLVLIKTIFVFVLLVVLTLFTIVFERKIVGRMQQRPGPNRNGPLGSLQSLADGVKLMLKEDIIPTLADKPVFLIAPIVATVPAFLAFAIIPFGPTVSVASNHTPLQLVDLPMALLFALAMSSLGVYGIVLAGWSSGSTYPLLGALRSAAQMVSYEVSMGLSLVAVLIFSGGLSTESIVTGQHGLWYAVQLFPSFVVYFVSAVGETNRAPFDLPEAEGELVGGFHTEYSSIKFALFFLAEYINMITVSAIATTVFLGGWRPPWPISFLDTGFLPIVWFLIKVLIFIFVFIWLRGTLPRLRYDQFMSFGWKVLVPFSLVWILVVSGIRTIDLHSTHDSWRWYVVLFGSVVVLALVAVSFMPQKKDPLDELHDDGSDDGTIAGDAAQTTIPAQAPAGRSPFLPWLDGLPPGARASLTGAGSTTTTDSRTKEVTGG